MAESRKDSGTAELETAIAKYENENEELKKTVKELQQENRMFETEIKDLKLDNEELRDRMNDLQIRNKKYESEISRKTELEDLKDKIFEEHIEELNNKLTQSKLEIKACVNYMQKLQNKNEKYKNMMKDIWPTLNNLGKIPTYTILRKHKYPYFIIRSTNYHEALEESKRNYPNLKEVYTVNYDDEETYSSSRLEREFKDIEIFDNEILFVNYTEQKFVEDLKNFGKNDQTGCHTFSLIIKEEYPYYAYRVQKGNYELTKIKLKSRFPNSVEISSLSEIPNAIMLHNKIKEKFPEHVSGNHIKLPDNDAEEEFIREVERMAKPSLSP